MNNHNIGDGCWDEMKKVISDFVIIYILCRFWYLCCVVAYHCCCCGLYISYKCKYIHLFFIMTSIFIYIWGFSNYWNRHTINGHLSISAMSSHFVCLCGMSSFKLIFWMFIFVLQRKWSTPLSSWPQPPLWGKAIIDGDVWNYQFCREW